MAEILDIIASDHAADIFILFGADQYLYLYHQKTDRYEQIVKLQNITLLQKPVKLYVHYPYVCVTERYGVNAALVSLIDNSYKPLTREDYHADVSSYSIGFAKYEGHVCLIHQTQWNRLDITDLDTGRLLTEREVWAKEAGQREDGNGVKYEYKNYLDYFHSLIHVSPTSTSFLTNGWVWSPVDNIRCFSLEEFLNTYENGSFGIDYSNGYNWDRPCTFIDDDTFVVATDDATENLDEEELKDYHYAQLHFFHLSDPKVGEKWQWLPPFRKVECDIFAGDTYKEVHGELYYDPLCHCLIALSAKGLFVVDMDGNIQYHSAEITNSRTTQHSDFGSSHAQPSSPSWQYAPQWHFLYAHDPESQKVKTLLLDGLINNYK